jgi:hypothetical protein
MKIVIRGHIRNSFTTDELYTLLKYLSEKYDIQIYIHTWNKKQTNLSWRTIENDPTEITNDTIKTYFKDLFKFVRGIIIEDDADIELYGNLDGKLASSKTSILGWKRYIYGQYRAVKHVYDTSDDTNEFLLNIRFDLFTNSYVHPYEEITKFVDNNYGINHANNVFIRKGHFCGIDNIIIGSIKSQYSLVSTIHLHLDDILKEYPELKNPEFVIPITNDMLYIDKK